MNNHKSILSNNVTVNDETQKLSKSAKDIFSKK